MAPGPEARVGAEELGQGLCLDRLAARGPAAVDEAHDVGVAVQCEQVVGIGLGERAQHEAVGLQEDAHATIFTTGGRARHRIFAAGR